MKTMRKYFFIVFIVAMLSLFLIDSDSRAEVNYAGEVCINLISNYSDAPYYVPAKTVQLGILSYGEGYFALNGKVTEAAGRTMPASGTAIIGGSNAALTLTAAEDIYSETFHIIVDRGTWAGWFTSIVHETFFTGAPPTPDLVVSRYDVGTAILYNCPK